MRAYVVAFSLVLAASGLAIVRAAEPGLKLTIESKGAPDARVSRLITLRVPENSPASPFIAPGPFKATWEGNLALRIKDTCTFFAAGRGAFKLTINDEVVLETAGDDLAAKKSDPINLKKGANVIRAEYTSPGKGEAWVRLYWTNPSFIPEAVPPMAFTHYESDDALAKQSLIRTGRELFATLRCIKCHAPADGKPTDGAMPELSADVPSLAELPARVKNGWLARWIHNPRSMRAQAHMPRLFTGAKEGEVDERARDIAAYLVPPAPPPEDGKKIPCEDGDAGARVFVALGCIACHTPPKAAADPGRLSLAHVAEKYYYGQLKRYLLKPEAHYAWTLMPNFRLSDREAHVLAVYLKVTSPLPPADPPPGDPKRGRALLQTSGCLSCHTGPTGEANRFVAMPLTGRDWKRGCVSNDESRRGNAPDFSLDHEQRAALRAFAAAGLDSLNRDAPAEFAERQIAQLNCVACHSRDKQDDAWSQLSGEADAILGKLPPAKDAADAGGDQSRPPLTWAGEKLRPEWMTAFIAGELPYKPRPWLAARMPGFPSRAKLLAQGLALEHGCATSLPCNEKPDPQLAAIGMKLVGKSGGFSCVQCHAVGSMQALAAFEAPATNFAHARDRLTKEFYDRWIYNPQRVLPGTRMPQFADSEGKTALKEVLGGDARKQFDAIWNYLLAGPDISPPQQ